MRIRQSCGGKFAWGLLLLLLMRAPQACAASEEITVKSQILDTVTKLKWPASPGCAFLIRHPPLFRITVIGNHLIQEVPIAWDLLLSKMAQSLDAEFSLLVDFFPKFLHPRLREIYFTDRYLEPAPSDTSPMSLLQFGWNGCTRTPTPLIHLSPEIRKTVLLRRFHLLHKAFQYGFRILEGHGEDLRRQRIEVQFAQHRRDELYLAIVERLLLSKIPFEIMKYDIETHMSQGQVRSICGNDMATRYRMEIVQFLNSPILIDAPGEDLRLAQRWVERAQVSLLASSTP